MSIFKRSATCLAVMVSAVAATTAVTASPSSAASDLDAWALCKMGIILCGDAHFVSDAGSGNERLEISDDATDGYGVAVENYRYDLADIGPYFGWNRNGAGTIVNYTLHITEGARFEMRICPEQNGAVLYQYCSAWENGYA
ncbi:hypothetical protein GCM10023322_33620 [Rugosimonospora acidiphila]|uniref:Secreted protein n=1 Tax=Rugosimonospora acidiphila TaxID=556531 RepID=A0ABP9RUC3_9ACTN